MGFSKVVAYGVTIAALGTTTVVIQQQHASHRASKTDGTQPNMIPLGEFHRLKFAESVRTSAYTSTSVTIHSSGRWEPDSAPNSVPTEHEFFCVDVSLKNDSTKGYGLKPLQQYQLWDVDGTTYSATRRGPTPRLPARWMDPGDEVRGCICFNVSEDSKPEYLYWAFRKFSL